jgi:hypothetical protein
MNKTLLLFLLISTPGLAQTPIEKQLYDPEKLKQDLSFLFERLELFIHRSIITPPSKKLRRPELLSRKN